MNGPDQDRTRERGSFRLGDRLVEPERNRLSGPDGAHRMDPREMDVLVLLAGRPFHVFTREQIVDAVWGEAGDGERALTRVISELKRLLDDDRRVPRFLESIGKDGYRLVIAPSPVEDPTTPPSAGAGSTSPGLQPIWIAAPILILLLIAIALVVPRQAGGPGGSADHPIALRAMPISNYPWEEPWPAISPDGARVAFGWGGPEGDNLDVYVKRYGSDLPMRLTDDPGVETYPRWSADGGLLAYLHVDRDGQAIYSIPLAGGEPSLLVQSDGWFAGHSWSPDGRRLVYAEGADESAPARLFLLDLETGMGRALLPAPAGGQGDVSPVYSPDGGAIAFARIDENGLDELYVVSVASGEVRRITRGALHTKGMDWSRDGRSLIYSGVCGANCGLWRVDVGDGSVSGLRIRGEWIQYPTVARGADRLVFQSVRFDKDIWQVRRSGNPDAGLAIGPLITSERWDSQGNFSPDASRVAFVSSRSGHLEIWTAAADGSQPRQLTRFAGANVGNPVWSPDGRRIAFHANPGGFNELYTVGADGTSPVPLSGGQHNHLVSGWSRDGEWIYYGSDRSGRWEIWRLRPDEPEERAQQLTAGGGIVGHESADGKVLYFTRPDSAGLWSLPLTRDGAEPGVVLGSLPALGDWAIWGCHDRGVAVVLPDSGGPVLCTLDFDGGGLQSVTRVPGVAGSGLGVTADGLSILYTRKEARKSDLMFVKNFR